MAFCKEFERVFFSKTAEEEEEEKHHGSPSAATRVTGGALGGALAGAAGGAISNYTALKKAKSNAEKYIRSSKRGRNPRTGKPGTYLRSIQARVPGRMTALEVLRQAARKGGRRNTDKLIQKAHKRLGKIYGYKSPVAILGALGAAAGGSAGLLRHTLSNKKQSDGLE